MLLLLLIELFVCAKLDRATLVDQNMVVRL